jgi:hypothetical protein
VPDCEKSMKPVVGMTFESLDEVEKFYKTYAHECGFSVRIEAQGKKSDVVEHKRFVCSREGFTKRRSEPNKQKKLFETRCGCNARIYVRLGQDNRYYIASFGTTGTILFQLTKNSLYAVLQVHAHISKMRSHDRRNVTAIQSFC